MKNTDKGLRKFHAARMKQRARKIYPGDKAARLADHLAACSCEACGNPRRHFGERTIPEQRSDIAAAQAIREIGLPAA